MTGQLSLMLQIKQNIRYDSAEDNIPEFQEGLLTSSVLAYNGQNSKCPEYKSLKMDSAADYQTEPNLRI